MMETTSEEVNEIEGDTTEESRGEDEVTDEATEYDINELVEGEEERAEVEEEKAEEKKEEKVSDAEAEATRRKRILNEILTTEQSYVHSLDLIVKVYTFLLLFFYFFLLFLYFSFIPFTFFSSPLFSFCFLLFFSSFHSPMILVLLGPHTQGTEHTTSDIIREIHSQDISQCRVHPEHQQFVSEDVDREDGGAED